MSHEVLQVRHETLQACIEACIKTSRSCERFISDCLERVIRGDESLPEDSLRLCRDCIDICNLSVSLMQRQDPLHAQAAGICADIAERMIGICNTSDGLSQTCRESCAQTASLCQLVARN